MEVVSSTEAEEAHMTLLAIEQTSISFETELIALSGFVKGIISQYGFNRETSEDIYQETILKALEKRDTLRSVKALPGWIKRIAHNKCLDLKRSDRNSKLVGSCFLEGVEAKNIAESLSREERIRKTTAYLDSLENSARNNVAKAFYTRGVSLKIITSEMEIPQNTALSHLSRFRARAKKELPEHLENGLALCQA